MSVAGVTRGATNPVNPASNTGENIPNTQKGDDTKGAGRFDYAVGQSSTAVDISQIITELHKLEMTLKKNMKDIRDLEREAVQQDLQKAADKIRSAAKLNFAASLTSGIAQVGSGVISLAGGIHGIKKASAKFPKQQKLDATKAKFKGMKGSYKAGKKIGDKLGKQKQKLQKKSQDLKTEQKNLEAKRQGTAKKDIQEQIDATKAKRQQVKNEIRAAEEVEQHYDKAARTKMKKDRLKAEAKDFKNDQVASINRTNSLYMGISEGVKGLGQIGSSCFQLKAGEQEKIRSVLSEIQQAQHQANQRITQI